MMGDDKLIYRDVSVTKHNAWMGEDRQRDEGRDEKDGRQEQNWEQEVTEWVQVSIRGWAL
jgi:hypothetical protein